jgi:SAM-dependent MidA family methyltransferase
MTPLKARMLRQIARSGPIPLPDYWAQCLFDPEHGYYTTGYPIGAEGDFITAPEVSQMFGEVIAAWWLATVRQNGLRDIALVEIGPGRGTLMFDMLRTLGKLAPELKETMSVHMVEVSPRLTGLQREKLAGSGFRINWHQSLETLPIMPLGIIANELFDAIPIRSFVKHDGNWYEQAIGADTAENFAFHSMPASLNLSDLPVGHDAKADGSIFEYAPAREAMIQQIACQISQSGGFGLFVDYGHAQSSFGDTLQAIKKHAFANPLEDPGDADLTSHVDFEALANAARREGANVSAVLEQGNFLKRLGIVERTEQLSNAKPPSRNAIETACERLTGEDQMGSLFKVMGIAAPKMILPALDDHR